MEEFLWSICYPDQEAPVEKGPIPGSDIANTFAAFPWMEQLQKLNSMKEEEIRFSPSMEFRNTGTGEGISISIVGSAEESEFYFFYRRPKTIRTFLGLSRKKIENFVSDLTGLSKEDVLELLQAFVRNDRDSIEARMK